MSQSGDEVAADRTPLVSIDVEAVAGGPAPVLLDAAEGADLLVLGHRGRGAFSSAVLGARSGCSASYTRSARSRSMRPTVVAED